MNLHRLIRSRIDKLRDLAKVFLRKEKNLSPSAARPMPSGSTAGRDTLSEAHPHASDTFLPPLASRRGRVRTWLADALGLTCIFGITWFGLVAGWVMS